MKTPKNNFVAKYCRMFNKAKIEQSVKQYKRKEKHSKKFEDHLIVFA